MWARHRFHRWPLLGPSAAGAVAAVVLAGMCWRGMHADRQASQLSTVLASSSAERVLAPGDCAIVGALDAATVVVEQRQAGDTARFRVHLLGAQTADSAAGSQSLAAYCGPATLELDKRRFNASGEWLAYVWVDGQLLNAETIRSGWARHEVYPGDSFAAGRLLAQAEREAREAKRGLWRAQTAERANEK